MDNEEGEKIRMGASCTGGGSGVGVFVGVRVGLGVLVGSGVLVGRRVFCPAAAVGVPGVSSTAGSIITSPDGAIADGVLSIPVGVSV